MNTEGRLEVSPERFNVHGPGLGEAVVRMEAAPVNPTGVSMLLGPADPARAEVQGTGGDQRLVIPLSSHQAASLNQP